MSAKERKSKYELLRRYIKAKLIIWNYSKEELAIMLGVSLASVYNKLNDPAKFTFEETQTIFYKLKFTDEEKLQVL